MRAVHLSWLVLFAAVLFCSLTSLQHRYPTLSLTSGNPFSVPLLIPWPVLLIGTRGVHYLHQLMIKLSPPQQMLLWHSGSFAITGALRAAAKLNLADALETGPLDIYSLANLTNTHSPNLERLLLALETIGTFKQNEHNQWENSPISEFLRTNHPASMRAAVIMLGEEQFVAFSRLDYSVSTGRAAFPRVYGKDFWQYLDYNPHSQSIFDDGQHGLSFLVDGVISSDYDFGGITHLCDVAGGKGALLRHLLTQYPAMRGTLFERLPVIDHARDDWLHSHYVNRTLLVSGDFFDYETLPTSCDAYMLKQVLHHWSDDYAVVILKNLFTAIEMSIKGNPRASLPRVLIIDRVMNAQPYKNSFVESHGASFVDLVMMSNFEGGYERNERQWRAVLEQAGFVVNRIVSTRSEFSVIEAVPSINVH